MGHGYGWTFDRERDVFFIPVAWGKEEFSNEVTCVLGLQGKLLVIKIVNLGGDLDYPHKTGSVKWGLLGIQKPSDFSMSDDEIVVLLKEALTAYQLDGIRHPMHSFAVTFNF